MAIGQPVEARSLVGVGGGVVGSERDSDAVAGGHSTGVADIGDDEGVVPDGCDDGGGAALHGMRGGGGMAQKVAVQLAEGGRRCGGETICNGWLSSVAMAVGGGAVCRGTGYTLSNLREKAAGEAILGVRGTLGAAMTVEHAEHTGALCGEVGHSGVFLRGLDGPGILAHAAAERRRVGGKRGAEGREDCLHRLHGHGVLCVEEFGGDACRPGTGIADCDNASRGVGDDRERGGTVRLQCDPTEIDTALRQVMMTPRIGAKMEHGCGGEQCLGSHRCARRILDRLQVGGNVGLKDGRRNSWSSGKS
mmetsp:Transcript_53407/g.125623  ORF Transcript_53407/g.125623 Transcript_53407/m.125623 type:complete len:306 (+) Transcript_53407:576-1493(+)